MLADSLATLLGTAINTGLNLNPDSAASLRPLQGKTLTIHLQELGLPMMFSFTAAQVAIRINHHDGPSTNKPVESTERADLIIRTTLIHLIRLSQTQESSQYLLQHGIKIQGSIALAQSFSQLLQAAKPDWEHLLAQWVGDAPTHLLAKNLQQQRQWLKESHQALQYNVSEYLQEEVRWVVHPLELDTFLVQTDHLYQDTERLAARIKRLSHD